MRIIYRKSDGKIMASCDDASAPNAGFDWLEASQIENVEAYQNLAEIPDISNLLIAKLREDLNARRELAWSGGFAHDGHVYDSQGRSESLIRGAAKLATANPALIVTWTLSDNSEIELDAAGILALDAALTAHGATVFEAYRAKKNALANLTLSELINYEMEG